MDTELNSIDTVKRNLYDIFHLAALRMEINATEFTKSTATFPEERALIGIKIIHVKHFLLIDFL